jgi:hypothetical protein
MSVFLRRAIMGNLEEGRSFAGDCESVLEKVSGKGSVCFCGALRREPGGGLSFLEV